MAIVISLRLLFNDKTFGLCGIPFADLLAVVVVDFVVFFTAVLLPSFLSEYSSMTECKRSDFRAG